MCEWLFFDKILFDLPPEMAQNQGEKEKSVSSSRDFDWKISQDLNKKLGPGFISYRQGHGMKELAYLEGWAAISIANRIFGYNIGVQRSKSLKLIIWMKLMVSFI